LQDLNEKISVLKTMLDKAGFSGNIQFDIPLAPLTWYRIGGPASALIEIGNIDDLISVKSTIGQLEIPWTLIGGGANLLVSDNGYKGVVVKLTGPFSNIAVDVGKMQITAGSSSSLPTLVREGADIGFRGIERLTGIPGSVGGAIYMNAGTYGEYIGSLIESVEVLTNENAVATLASQQCEFAYRTSRFQKTGEIILGAIFKSEKIDPDKIKTEIDRRLQRRRDTQPVDIPSCGCVFRNPEVGKPAGNLIQDAGLKGMVKGGAKISDKHANFFVNTGNATASDILFLMAVARKRIRDLYGIILDTEVELVGFDKPVEVILDALEKSDEIKLIEKGWK
jgi:UDP-N-acetylmuramate dehydrogenase